MNSRGAGWGLLAATLLMVALATNAPPPGAFAGGGRSEGGQCDPQAGDKGGDRDRRGIWGSKPLDEDEADVAIFGPTKYTRTAGPPNQFTDAFGLPATLAAPFRLHVQNGDPDGSHRVSSATITLNGVEVAGPSDFSQQIAGFDRTVTLQAHNTLQVHLASKPGGFLILTVYGTVPPPTLAKLEPPSLRITRGGTGTLTATISATQTTPTVICLSSEAIPATGRFGATVTVTADNLDDRTVARFSRQFTGTPSEQSRQDNTITAVVPDQAGVRKPGAGGLRLLTTLATGEVLFSNPVPFTPLAQGRVRNDTAGALEVTITAASPITEGAPAALPRPVTVTVPPKGSVPDVILPTGFRYTMAPPVQGQPATGFPVEYLDANVDDFVFAF